MITDQNIERARNVDLIELIDKLDINYRQESGHIKIICPFHEEINPSMAIYEDHAWCFGCNKRLDSIGFIQELFNVDFKKAIEMLNKYEQQK